MWFKYTKNRNYIFNYANSPYFLDAVISNCLDNYIMLWCPLNGHPSLVSSNLNCGIALGWKAADSTLCCGTATTLTIVLSSFANIFTINQDHFVYVLHHTQDQLLLYLLESSSSKNVAQLEDEWDMFSTS